MMALLLDAELRVVSAAGARTVAARDFFRDALSVDLAEDEIVTEIVLPKLPPGTGWGFEEVARRSGDFALAAVAATLTLSDGNDRAGAHRHDRRRADARGVLRDAEKLLIGAAARRRRRRRRDRRGARRRRAANRPARLGGLSPPPRRRAGAARARRRVAARASRMSTRDITVTVNGTAHRHARRAAPAALRFPARHARPHRHACRLRARRVRRLHGAARRRQRARLPDVRRAGRRLPRRDGREPRPHRRSSIRCSNRSTSITRCNAASARPAC